MIPKTKPYRSEAYKAWIKTQPCVMCGAPADDPHHLKGVGNLSGAGLTAPDTYLMPMCRGCHTYIHEDPGYWTDQWEWVARTLSKAISEGVFVLKRGD
jgi:hypothetical protein